MIRLETDRDPLSIERIILARETLSSAFRQCAPYGDFLGAIGAKDVDAVFVEAKRNLGAFVQHRYVADGLKKAVEAEMT